MANTLTGLIPTIYQAADVVSRELTGFIPAVTLNASAEMAAKDQTISFPITESGSPADITPAATGPDPSDSSTAPGTMSITKERSDTFYWTGNDQIGVGQMYNAILRDQFAQSMRALVNEIEADLAALYVSASRAYGTPGTTPFGSDLGDSAQILKILLDNGSAGDRQLVINTASGAALRTLGQLTKVNEAGSDSITRQGILLEQHGFNIRESAQVKDHTKGAGASYLTNGATAVGVEDIALDTGSGAVLAGDVVTFAADTANKYVVGTGITAPGTISLNAPGAQVAIADNNAMTIGNSYAANLAFSRSAIHLLTRVPAMPEGGDAADDVTVVQDPRSGLAFQVAMYRQRRRVAFEVGIAWGVKAVKPEHMALLLG